MNLLVTLSGPIIAFAIVWGGCAGTTAIDPASAVIGREPTTKAHLVSPLCTIDNTCVCATTVDMIGTPAPGTKRFEVRLGPSQHEHWVRVGEHQLYKSARDSLACFYLDLEPGAHPVGFLAQSADGFAAGLRIRELGAAGPWWYESFEFTCGGPELCDERGLNEWKQQVSKVSTGKHAPCGSVRILDIHWTKGRMPDNVHPENLFLQASMMIYRFMPRHKPGAPDCVGEQTDPGMENL